jgi:hypothetical protein
MSLGPPLIIGHDHRRLAIEGIALASRYLEFPTYLFRDAFRERLGERGRHCVPNLAILLKPRNAIRPNEVIR